MIQTEIILFCLYYIVFDYVFYNITKKPDYGAPTYYRIMQIVFCWIPATFILEPTEFVQFFILWWTFCLDWGYYAVGVVFDYRHVKEDFANGITHAHWTPYGIFVNYFEQEKIPIPALIIQSVIGLAVAYSLGE